jgi:AraC-like DNA-binding protein
MEQVSNAQLANMICLSEDRFGHLFREGVGKPPLQYINDMRLKSALNLLKTGPQTVTEVADAVGFRDYNHFGRLFRKRYGCTPYEVKSGKVISEEILK